MSSYHSRPRPKKTVALKLSRRKVKIKLLIWKILEDTIRTKITENGLTYLKWFISSTDHITAPPLQTEFSRLVEVRQRDQLIVSTTTDSGT
uniref:Pco090977 n=1 Tax=Arundo donax TaxID=35708 RepID=A0A0A9FNY0_ARUDO